MDFQVSMKAVERGEIQLVVLNSNKLEKCFFTLNELLGGGSSPEVLLIHS